VRKLVHCFTLLVFLVNSTEAVLAAESAPAKNASPESEKKAAEKKPAEKRAKTTKATKPQRLKGEITALDAKAGTVSVKGASGEKAFTTQDAARDTLEIVKVGEHVGVTYSEKDGKLVATSMKRMKPKSASSGTKEKKPSQGPPPAKDGGETKQP
jgi:ribosomal protein S1